MLDGGDRFGVRRPFLRHRGVDRQRHRCDPAAVVAGADVPVRVDDDRLMDQLEAAFRLADGFDGERPDVHRLIGLQFDVDAEPFVGEAEVVDVFEIEARAELAERVAVRVVEVAVVAAAGQAGEVELDAEMDQLAGRQTFDHVGDSQVLAAGF